MKLSNFLAHGLAAGLVGLLAATTSLGVSAAGDAPSSGFIPATVESQLQEVKVSDGRKAHRWVSPQFTRDNYSAVMVDRVVFYPAPNPGPQVSSQVLEQIADYLTDALRRELGKSVKLAEQAGPGVLRMQPAITAVVVKKEGLSAKDIIPVHLLFSAVSAASGKMDEKVTVTIEVRITDSVSGDYRAAAKLGLKGDKLDNNKDQLTLQDFQKALDKGATTGAKAIQEALAP